jgi:hypothetical protein
MEFFIKQSSTLPMLELELIQDGFNSHLDFYDKIQNAEIKFSMQDVKSCSKRVICQPMIVQDCAPKCQNCFPEYKMIYKWRQKDTLHKGRYEGIIEINFLDGCGKLIAPIHEKLYINII